MLHSSVCSIPRFAAGRPDQNSETAEKENAPRQQRLDLQSVNKTADDRDDEKGGEVSLTSARNIAKSSLKTSPIMLIAAPPWQADEVPMP
jgi:hypothetical protein